MFYFVKNVKEFLYSVILIIDMYPPDIDPTKSTGGISTALVLGILALICVVVLVIVAIIMLGNSSNSNNSDDSGFSGLSDEMKDIVELRDNNEYSGEIIDRGEAIEEIQDIGWMAMNKSQHEYKIDNTDIDNDSEKLLNSDDITAISTMFKKIHDYTVKLNYSNYRNNNRDKLKELKEKKREYRRKFQDKLVELMVKCEPYGKTYNGFNQCVQSYLVELNTFGPEFVDKKNKWEKKFDNWSFTESGTAGDINLDYMLRDKIRSIHFDDKMPGSNYSEDSDEVQLLGWLAYNDAQHSYMMNKAIESSSLASSEEDEDEDENKLTIEDIMKIANYFKDEWDYADTKKFNASGGKQAKRDKRNEFKSTLLSMKNTCKPYGKTYNEFKECTQSYMLKLNELGPSFDGDHFKDLGVISLESILNQEEQFTNYSDDSNDDVKLLGWLTYQIQKK